MTTGRAVLALLEREQSAQRRVLQREKLLLSNLQQQHLSVVESRRLTIVRIAEIRVKSLRIGEITEKIKDCDIKVQQVLDERRRVLLALEQQQRDANDKLEQLTQLETQNEKKLEAAEEALNDKVALSRARFTEEHQWKQLFNLAKEKSEQTVNARDKAKRAEQELEHKRLPYEADILFMYLWNRQYLTNQYSANSLIRTLDGWVASKIGYLNAQKNYSLLKRLPGHLLKHAQKMVIASETSTTILDDYEKQQFTQDGVMPYFSSRDEAETSYLNSLKQRDESANDCLLLQQQLNTYARGEDALIQRARKLMYEDLDDDTINELQMAVMQTAVSEDDNLVDKVESYKKEISSLSNDINQQTADFDLEKEKELRLLRLLTKFRSHGYHRSNSRFSSSLDMGRLIQSLIVGSGNFNSVWRKLDRDQYSYSPPSYTSNNSGGGFGGGSGGFGGGGFSGGGGFGGGGGFSSGGGF